MEEYNWEHVDKRSVFVPEPTDEQGFSKFNIIVGLLAPNGDVGIDNPMFKQPNEPTLNGYRYKYQTHSGRKVTVTVEFEKDNGGEQDSTGENEL